MEPPKEEPKHAEQNGPVDGQGDSPGPQAAEQGADTAVPSDADKKLPEMDIDWLIPTLVYIKTDYYKALSCQLCSKYQLEQANTGDFLVFRGSWGWGIGNVRSILTSK